MTEPTAQSAPTRDAITRLRNTAAFEHERREYSHGFECMCGQPWPCEEQQQLRDDADAIGALLDERDALAARVAEFGGTFQFRVCQSPRGVVANWTDAVGGYMEFVGDPHAGRPRLEFRTAAAPVKPTEGRADV